MAKWEDGLERIVAEHGLTRDAARAVRSLMHTGDSTPLGLAITASSEQSLRSHAMAHAFLGARVAPENLPDRYEDRGFIAAGGMGEVRRVFDRLLGRELAMKLTRPNPRHRERLALRFAREARLTARLQHPGIVAVHDFGSLPDGRLWFTMQEVRGKTLKKVIAEVHAVSQGQWAEADGWTFRRLVDAFIRVCEAVSYAHEMGVLHRDIKPANIMVGRFGEVKVMDWGLGRVLTESWEALDTDTGSVSTTIPTADGELTESQAPESSPVTQDGQVVGTPFYMAPEQAMGELEKLGPATDIYALGAVLFTILTGEPPPPGRNLATSWLRQRQANALPLPEPLVDICLHALAPAPAERHASVGALADELEAWAQGARRRAKALEVVEEADALVPEMEGLKKQADALRADAKRLLRDVKPSDPVTRKAPGWAAEDAAADLERAVARKETAYTSLLQTALHEDPETPEANQRLADFYRDQLSEAEASGHQLEADRFEALLRVYDDGRHAAYLSGTAALTLVTEPPGAEVVARRYMLKERRLQLGPAMALGSTPLREVALEAGSYLLEVSAPGRRVVHYPVEVARGGHWDGCPPAESEPFPIVLPQAGELGDDDVYVPAGWFVSGGPMATDGAPVRRIWCDAFVVKRFPVTCAQYVAFLNATAPGEGVHPHNPTYEIQVSGESDQPVFQRDPETGRFAFGIDGKGRRWQDDWPVVLATWHDCMAYCAWLTQTTHTNWRLPAELEWEKAARGVDGRIMPWGDYPEPTWARMLHGLTDVPRRTFVDSYPVDTSPYGVRGTAGNCRDWCLDLYRKTGPDVRGGMCVVAGPPASAPGHRVVKGGAWGSAEHYCLLPSRFGNLPEHRRAAIGFRVARSYLGMV